MAGLKLIQIEGIGPIYADKFLKVGIETTEELLLVDPKRVAKRTGIPYASIEAWQDMSDLIRILGVGPEYAEALNKVGIDSCPELAQRDPESTLAKLQELVEKTGVQVIRRLPTLDEVKDWITQAKTLEPVD